ncbi:glycoside hydrolase family 18 protein [Alsobacter sp. KACC 23698]|uniref:chitinase n=1 Tax=Alsobacter sp. KACC 23698 TaxID=3149229 RepID=A0AAU7JIL5_9HYPH
MTHQHIAFAKAVQPMAAAEGTCGQQQSTLAMRAEVLDTPLPHTTLRPLREALNRKRAIWQRQQQWALAVVARPRPVFASPLRWSIIVAFLIGVMMAARAAFAADGGPAAGARWVSAYFVGWDAHTYPPSLIDFAQISHVLAFAVLPNMDGSLDTSLYLDDSQGPQVAKDLVRRAHLQARKALVSVGGAGLHDRFAAAASAPVRPRFVSALLALVAQWGYDGLDLDWEPIEEADYDDFLALVREIRQAQPSIIITVALGSKRGGRALEPSYRRFCNVLAPLVDQVNVMTYGMAGPWQGWLSWHSSPLRGDGPSQPISVAQNAADLELAGVPRSKIGVGVGFYGQGWGPLVTGPRQNLAGNANEVWMVFRDISRKYMPWATASYDRQADAAYLSVWPPRDGISFISYENEASIAAKIRFIRDTGLGGAFVWDLSSGHIPEAARPDALLQAVGALLDRGSRPSGSVSTP